MEQEAREAREAVAAGPGWAVNGPTTVDRATAATVMAAAVKAAASPCSTRSLGSRWWHGCRANYLWRHRPPRLPGHPRRRLSDSRRRCSRRTTGTRPGSRMQPSKRSRRSAGLAAVRLAVVLTAVAATEVEATVAALQEAAERAGVAATAVAATGVEATVAVTKVVVSMVSAV